MFLLFSFFFFFAFLSPYRQFVVVVVVVWFSVACFHRLSLCQCKSICTQHSNNDFFLWPHFPHGRRPFAKWLDSISVFEQNIDTDIKIFVAGNLLPSKVTPNDLWSIDHKFTGPPLMHCDKYNSNKNEKY